MAIFDMILSLYIRGVEVLFFSLVKNGLNLLLDNKKNYDWR